jgi:hypothetical protein
MKTIIKFLVVSAILLITSCVSDTHRQVQKEYNLSEIYSNGWNKSKAEVVMDEIEARVDRMDEILDEIQKGADIERSHYKITALDEEIQRLVCSPYLNTGDYVSPQLKRIAEKAERMRRKSEKMTLQ